MEALKEEGNKLFRKGLFVRAIDTYRKAVEAAGSGSSNSADPLKELAAVHSNLSCSLFKLGQFDEALEEAKNCISAMPEWNKGWFRKGEAEFGLRQYVAAEESYKRSLDIKPDDFTVKKRMMSALEAQQGFFFRQLFPGREFCVGKGSNVIESQVFRSALAMRNFVYLVGDASSREVVVVDPAWDVEGIKRFAEEEGVKIVGVVVTHYHFDHTGGIPPPPFDSLGIRVPGTKEISESLKVKVYVNKNDAGTLKTKNSVSASSIVELEDGSNLKVGNVALKFLHTPGHTPGSMCIYIERIPGQEEEGIVISGDTLFIGSCGRLDLPDCDAKAMYQSLKTKLASLPDSTRVYPGHDYGGTHTSIGKEKSAGFLKLASERDWIALHSRQ